MLTTVGTWNIDRLPHNGQMMWGLNWMNYRDSAVGFIPICPATFPETLAVDAALEFMDRYIERRFPREIDSEKKAMQFCFQNARRQR